MIIIILIMILVVIFVAYKKVYKIEPTKERVYPYRSYCKKYRKRLTHNQRQSKQVHIRHQERVLRSQRGNK